MILHKNYEGFSLIELMVAVAVLGILAVIAIPQFKKYRDRSANTHVISAFQTARTSAVACDAEDIAPANCDIRKAELENSEFVGSVTYVNGVVTVTGAGAAANYVCSGNIDSVMMSAKDFCH